MIQFKEINGQLCIMLEKPIPLTTDAKFPCVVRLIQDDSPMGRLNRRHRDTNIKQDIKYICVSVKNYVMQTETDSIMAIEAYELIGYPVADGSAEWAYYIWKQKNNVINGYNIFPSNYSLPDEEVYEQMKYIAATGWQLYEPKAEPCPACNGTGVVQHDHPNGATQTDLPVSDATQKPLLSAAKVGDLCQRSNGRYTQFHSKHKLNDGTIAYYFDDVSGSTNIDGDHCSHECGNNIVSCEPLAPIGSAEWALQMMKLGKDVCRKGHETAYYHICNDGKEIACSLKNERRLTCGHLLVSKWGETGNDWQLYEPKPDHCTKQINPITESGMALSTLINGLSEIKKSFGDSNIHFIDSIPNDDNSVTPTTSKNGEFGVIVHINKSPSDVVVDFGSFRGTIELNSHPFENQITVKNTQGDAIAYINIVYLDTPTRKLVQELLKAQEES